MQSTPFVSIVLFCYNAEPYLQKVIESLLGQTYKHFELIIIEDCSTDGSLSIVSSFSDPRIVLIRNEENHGIAFNRKLSFTHAKGHYIFWMDNDDIAAPERIERQVAYFEQHPDVVLCGTGATIIDVDDVPQRQVTYPATDEEIKAAMFFGFPFMSPSVGIRMSAVKTDHLKPLSLVKQADDYTLYSMLMDEGRFINLPDQLYYYREHNNPNRITTNPARGADIVAGRKVAWRIQLKKKGIATSDEVLTLHDKLSYYTHLVNKSDVKYAPDYCALLLMIFKSSSSISTYRKSTKTFINRCITNLLSARILPRPNSLLLQLRYASLISLKTHVKLFLRRGLI